MRNILFIFSFFILLNACSNNEPPEPQKNLFGGLNRNNNYEFTGNFYTYTIQTINLKDKNGFLKSPLAISYNQFVAPLNDGSIAFFTNDSIAWKVNIGENYIAANICADANSNIYALNSIGELISISSAGKINWKVQALNKKEQWTLYSDPLVNSEGVACACSAGELVFIGFDGSIKWRKDFSLSPIERFSGDIDGNIYIPISHYEFGKSDSLLAIDKNGAIKWAILLDSARLYLTPALYKNTLLIPAYIEKGEGRVSNLYSINKENGQITWKKESPQKIRNISIDGKGTIYLSCADIGISESISQIIAMDNKGETLWSNYLENTIISPIFISKKKLAFLGAKGEAIGVYMYSKDKGEYLSVLSLTECLPFVQIPTISPDGTIVLASKDKFAIYRINQPEIYKLLPY